MIFKEKLRLLDSYEEIEDLNDEQINILKKLSYDSNAFIRGLVASLLYKKVNLENMYLLFRLSKDHNDYVRLEAYDSLSFFHCKKVSKFLVECISSENNPLNRSYAIDSLIEVIVSLNIVDEYIKYIEESIIDESSTICLLSYLYALNLFGKDNITQILFYLNDSSYYNRFAVIQILSKIVNDNNRLIIVKSLKQRLLVEQCRSVKIKIQELLFTLGDS